ncbi:MAG: glycosyltransferase family 2 protein [Candidatus Shapirobacteria bacterium]|jgi:glycosyltransferase involved in cell wall biosynthesis
MNLKNKTKKVSLTPGISLMLLTKNEEGRVATIQNWIAKCPKITEVVCVDDLSTDDTVKIVKKLASPTLKVLVLSHPLNNNFSTQRQLAVDSANNDWIFWLDADETPSPELISLLNEFNFNSQSDMAFSRTDTFLGHRLNHGETSSIRLIRLFNRKYGHFEGKVHETWISSQPVTFNRQFIFHNPHPTLKIFLEKINFYTDIRSQELFDQKVKTNLFQIVFYPTAKFVHNYFFRLGFLDSTPGIIFALGMSLHSFLVRSKLWHRWSLSSST